MMKTKIMLSCILVALLSYWALSLYAIQATSQTTSFWFVSIWGTHILWFTSLGNTEILSLPSIWGTHIPVIFAIILIAFFLLALWIEKGKIILSCILVALLAYWAYSMYVIQETHQSTPIWPTPFPFGDLLFREHHISVVYVILALTCLLLSLILIDALGDKLKEVRSRKELREYEGQEIPRTRRKIVEGASDPHYLDEKQVETEYNADLPNMIVGTRERERTSAGNAGVDFKVLTVSGNVQNKTTESAQVREVRFQEMLIRHVNFALDKGIVISVSENLFSNEIASLPSLAPYYTALSKGDHSVFLTALSKGDYSALTVLGNADYSVLLAALGKGDYSALTTLSKGDYSVLSKIFQDPIQAYIKKKCDKLDKIVENTPILISGRFSFQKEADQYRGQLDHPVNKYLLNGQKHYIFTTFFASDEMRNRYKYYYEELIVKGGNRAEIVITLYGTMLPIIAEDKLQHIRIIPTAIW